MGATGKLTGVVDLTFEGDDPKKVNAEMTKVYNNLLKYGKVVDASLTLRPNGVDPDSEEAS